MEQRQHYSCGAASDQSRAALSTEIQRVMGELERLSQETPEGFTIDEMRSATGHSAEWCRKEIGKLKKAGLVKYNGEAQRLRIDDRICYKPVYLVTQ